MNRKSFLSSVIPLVSVASAFGQNKSFEKTDVLKKIPPYLKKGDTIGITCPSGFISLDECVPAINKMQSWGFNIRVGNTVGLKYFSLAGTDAERAKELQEMINDDSIKAIMLGRGGYGAVRIIDKIDFSKFVKKPKWVIGFSDATVFHCHINKNCGIGTIHSKMCNSFPVDFSTATQQQIDSIDSIRKCLVGEKMIYERPVNFENRFGEGMGALVGGNLSIIEMLDGSVSKLQTDGRILFIEDVGEYRYKIDGMLWNLKRSKRLDKLKGLIVGEFRLKNDDPEEDFGSSLRDMVMEKVDEFHYPVCFDFPVGHVRENYALKCGVHHSLQVSERGTILREI
jgi:muramoyltetrapeptide carboxypeptidase